MDIWIFLVLGVIMLGIGIWVGIGAPGWPHKPQYRRRHSSKRSLNPIARGRSTDAVRRRR